MQVSGGAGSVVVDVEELVAASAVLLDQAGALGEAATRLAGTCADGDLLRSAVLDPGGWAEAEQQLLGASAAVAAQAAQAGALGAAVRAAALGYEHGDELVALGVAELQQQVGGAAGQALFRLAVRYPGAVAIAADLAVAGYLTVRTLDLYLEALAGLADDAVRGDLDVQAVQQRMEAYGLESVGRMEDDGDAVLEWLARNPEVAQHVAGATPSFLSGVTGLRLATGGPKDLALRTEAGRWSFPPQDVDDLALWTALLGGATGVMGLPGRVTVRAASTAPVQPTRPPRGVEDLVRGAVALAPARDGTLVGEPGRIRVERVVSGGQRRAIVYVPATQTWSLGNGTNPNDVAGNVHTMAGLRSDAQGGVVQALRAAGVARDEPLLLVGYSQGGLTSMALAEDAAFRAEFSPQAVLTVGAPLAGFDPPEELQVLSIEHAEDLVTVVDGAPNPATPGWTTVRRELLDRQDGDEVVQAAIDDDPFAPHRADPYVHTAARVDGSGHPSVQAWKDTVAPFLDGPGSTSTVTDWVAERVDAEAPTGPR